MARNLADDHKTSVLYKAKLDEPDVLLPEEGDKHRQIGITSAIFLIFNRMVGAGIFATPSAILALSGSVGLTLIIWVIGMLIAMAGLMTFMEFGTGLPQNGGEKNYLEYIFGKRKLLATCMYGSYVFFLGWAGSNSVIFGEYILNAAKIKVGTWNQRLVGFACITTAFLIHGLALNWGLRLQNFLGTVKLAILFLIALSGFAALAGHVKLDEKPDNFHHIYEGTAGSVYGIVTALFNVIWSFIGYNNANYALAETKNPVRTLKIAAPLALGLVSALYMLINVAYFAAVPKADIIGSGRIVAALYFRNVFGAGAEQVLSVFVALSAFGNVLSVIFSQVVQEIGREGIVPFSRLWASNKPFNAPLAGLFEHWIVSVTIMLAPPPGDAYNFILNVISYPVAVVNLVVAAGLLYLNRYPFSPDRNPSLWSPPFRATSPVILFFLLSNIFLVIAPFIPPTEGQEVYKNLPYYSHCLVGIGILAFGAVCWFVWTLVLPKLGNYSLVRKTEVMRDGWTRISFEKVPN